MRDTFNDALPKAAPSEVVQDVLTTVLAQLLSGLGLGQPSQQGGGKLFWMLRRRYWVFHALKTLSLGVWHIGKGFDRRMKQ